MLCEIYNIECDCASPVNADNPDDTTMECLALFEGQCPHNVKLCPTFIRDCPHWHGCCDVPESMIMAECPEFEKIRTLMSKGHSRPCAIRQHFGDGTCICGKGEE